jgi:oxazoline/thiazoline synthase
MQDDDLKLRLIPGFHIRELNQDKLMLLSEGDNYYIQDPLCVEVIKYLQHQETLVTLEEIQSRLQQIGMQVSIEQLKKITQETMKFSIVTTQDSSLPFPLQAFLFKAGLLPQVAEEKLRHHSVSVSSFSNCHTHELEEILQGLGIQTRKQGIFHILIVDDYLDTRIQEFNLTAQRSNLPWMLVKPHGRTLWIGPIFRPEEPSLATYESLALRLKENRSAEVDALGTSSEHFNLPSLIALPNTRVIGFNIAAMEIFKWIVSGTSSLISHILTLDTLNLSLEFHYVDFHPSTQNAQQPNSHLDHASSPSLKLVLNSSIKTFCDAEGARTRTPDETWRYIEHLMSPLTGLLSKIYYKQQSDYHVFYGPRSLSVLDPLHPLGGIRPPDIVVGKGTSLVKAKVGCVAEAIERYFCANHQLHPEYFLTYKEVKDEAIHPQILLNFSSKQYSNREKTNGECSPFQWVPFPFDETKEIHWLRMCSLNSFKERYIPSAYCYMHHRNPQELLMCPADSNGCACGNSLEEALFYGISEVIERDAMAIWWYNCLRRPTVDLDSFSNEAMKNIANSIHNQGRHFRVIDITTDIDIPAIAAVSWKKDGSRIVFGTSAHLDPQIAIVRALSELHQGLSKDHFSQNTDISSVHPDERDFVRWLLHEKIEQHPFLTEENGKKRVTDYPERIHHKDFLDDIQVYFERLRARFLDVYALNLTPLHSPMAVVKVIIPTMRHFWARYGEGRLYQVPVLLGDFLAPVKESELNRISYFL